MSDLVFYTNPQSRGRIVRRMLEECGAEYRTEIITFGPEQDTAFSVINPMRKVPALSCGGEVVTETAAIICLLADLFPEARLAPEPAERARYYRWLFFAAGPLEAAVTNRALGVEVPPDKQGFVGYGSYERVCGMLVSALTDVEWIAGDSYTAADVYLGSQVDYGLQFGMLPQEQALLDYRERLLARPAWQKAEEIDNALLAAAQQSGG